MQPQDKADEVFAFIRTIGKLPHIFLALILTFFVSQCIYCRPTNADGEGVEKVFGIEFSGFFDVTLSTYDNLANIFELGDFELDMGKMLGQYFQVGAALVFNGQNVEQAVGFIDFHLFGGRIAPKGRLFSERGVHFQIGKFDTVFGNDWKYYASMDRFSISAPLTTSQILDGGLNDVGFRFMRNSVFYNAVIFVIRGVETGVAYGGRLALTPLNNPYTLQIPRFDALEAGFSFIYDTDQNGTKEETLWAVDAEIRIGSLAIMGEIVGRNTVINEKSSLGFHFTAQYQAFELAKGIPLGFYGRYDQLRHEASPESGEESLSRLSGGVNLDLFEVAKLKAEISHFLLDRTDGKGMSFFLQLVVMF